jgi:hypothetical protein
MMLHVIMPLLHTHPVTGEKFLLKVDGSWIGRKVLVYLVREGVFVPGIDQ